MEVRSRFGEVGSFDSSARHMKIRLRKHHRLVPCPVVGLGTAGAVTEPERAGLTSLPLSNFGKLPLAGLAGRQHRVNTGGNPVAGIAFVV